MADDDKNSLDEMDANQTDSDYVCPIPATHDKFEEAHYFLHRMMKEFHEPEPFRWNLNAFLQALRSVTLMLQTELTHREGFTDWYSPWQKQMKQDELLQRFLEGRNTVVHKGMLQHKSRIITGHFRGKVIKWAFDIPFNVNERSEDILHFIIEKYADLFFIGKEHSAINEQFGVHRTWIVDDLGKGDEDVLILCHSAWSRVSQIVSAAHEFAGAGFNSINEEPREHDPETVNLLLESDIDPTLPEKWGWYEP